MTIHTDGKRTISDNTPRDEHWLTRLERELMELDRKKRELVYTACRQNTSDTFEWLACLEGALSV
jgi:hypothetical protein